MISGDYLKPVEGSLETKAIKFNKLIVVNKLILIILSLAIKYRLSLSPTRSLFNDIRIFSPITDLEFCLTMFATCYTTFGPVFIEEVTHLGSITFSSLPIVSLNSIINLLEFKPLFLF